MTTALVIGFDVVIGAFLIYDLLNDCLAALALWKGLLVFHVKNKHTGEYLPVVVHAPSGEPRRYVISGAIGVVFGALNLWVGAYWFGMPFVLSGLIDFWIAWTLWRRRRRGKPSWATGVVRRIGNRLAIVPVPQGAIS